MQRKNTMFNSNTDTGIRFGVIAVQSLDSDLAQELWYGSGATNLSYEEAYADAKAEAERSVAAMLEDSSIASAESGADREIGFERDFADEAWFDLHGHEFDPEVYVEMALEAFSDQCQIDEPVIEGEYEGVKYRISWLGGAPLLTVIEGPLGLGNRLCSPCVPGAVDLDGGYALDTEFERGYIPDTGFQCYCPPRDWLNKETT